MGRVGDTRLADAGTPAPRSPHGSGHASGSATARQQRGRRRRPPTVCGGSRGRHSGRLAGQVLTAVLVRLAQPPCIGSGSHGGQSRGRPTQRRASSRPAHRRDAPRKLVSALCSSRRSLASAHRASARPAPAGQPVLRGPAPPASAPCMPAGPPPSPRAASARLP